jgi:hypothetical protein
VLKGGMLLLHFADFVLRNAGRITSNNIIPNWREIMDKANKKLILGITITVAIALIAGFVPIMEVPYTVIIPDEPYEVYEINYKKIPILGYLLFKPSTPTEPSTPIIPPLAEPAPRELSTQEDVYDDKLGYGFEYPGGWGLYVGQDEFPDKNIKKLVSFQKEEKADDGSEVSVRIEFMVKSVTDLEESINEFKQLLQYSGVPILDEDTVSLKNIDGYDILSGIPTWKLRQVVFFANGTAYIFEYSSQEEFYRIYEETFNRIINSFYIQ